MSDSEKIASDMMLNEKIDALDKLTQVVSRGFASSTRYLLAVLFVASIMSVTLLDDLKDENNTIYKIEEVADGDKKLLVSNGFDFYEKDMVIDVIERQKKDIPFLGKVSEDQFYPIAIILLSLLMLLYGVSHSHAIRSRKLIGILLNESDKLRLRYRVNIECEKYNLNPVHVDDLIDSFVVPSINKISPLFQLIIDDKNQFLHQAHNQNIFRKIILLEIDVLLKFSILILICFFPVVVLVCGLVCWIYSVGSFNLASYFLSACLFALGFFALFAFFVIFYIEAKYVFQVREKLKNDLNFKEFIKNITFYMIHNGFSCSDLEKIKRFFKVSNGKKYGGRKYKKFIDDYRVCAIAAFCGCHEFSIFCRENKINLGSKTCLDFKRYVVDRCLGGQESVSLKNVDGLIKLDLRVYLYKYARNV